MTVTEKLNKFINEHGGGDARDALNVALARLDVADAQIKQMSKEVNPDPKKFYCSCKYPQENTYSPGGTMFCESCNYNIKPKK